MKYEIDGRQCWNRASRSMSWLKTRPEGGAQGESSGHQSPSTAGAAWRGAVPTLRGWRRGCTQGGYVPGEAGTYSSRSLSPTTRARSWARSVVGGYRNPPLAQQGCCDTPSSEIPDDAGVAASRKGDISAEKLESTAAT